MTEPAALLAAAHALLATPTADLRGQWPRAVALLGRQALERALDAFWNAKAPSVIHASRHAQLLCLGAYLGDRDAVDGARYAWHALSRACHHHVYELSPTAGELSHLLEITARVVDSTTRPKTRRDA